MDINNLLQQAEFALASYSDLPIGTPVPENLEQEGKGLSHRQAIEFASNYTVVTQFNDTDSSFSATVFKDSEGNLTLAIRGTLELTGFPSDFYTDTDIALNGAGYDQIIAMYNWWKRESSPSEDMFEQYKIDFFRDGVDPVPEGSVPLPGIA